ncbi:MAG: TetR family transcriptional regulator [Wenzhouxiangellaceae bacterium]
MLSLQDRKLRAKQINRRTKRPAPKREKLLDIAVNLFHREGYHSVSIDRILEEANVSRPTFFKHFPSKDDLIVTAMKRRDAAARSNFRDALIKQHDNPEQRLLAMFDLLAEWVQQENFTGCLFINATAEYADPSDPIHQAARDHKDAYREIILEQTRLLAIADPVDLAEKLMLLVDGLIVTAHVAGPRQFAQRAKELARVAIEHSTFGSRGASH